MEIGVAEHSRPWRALRFAGVLVAALVVVAVVAVGVIVLWLRAYAPLDADTGSFAPGPGVGAVIQPAEGSGGKVVFFPAYRGGRSFLASFTLHNSGHFTVTVEGLVPDTPHAPPWIGATELFATDSVSDGAPSPHSRPFHALDLSAGDTAVLVARFHPLCPAGRRRLPSVFTDRLRVRYRYLRWFTSEQTIVLPYAVTLRCVGGPVARP